MSREELVAVANDTLATVTLEIDEWGDGAVLDNGRTRQLDEACAKASSVFGGLLREASRAVDDTGPAPFATDIQAAFELATPLLREVAASLSPTNPDDLRLSRALDAWFLAATLATGLKDQLNEGTSPGEFAPALRPLWSGVVSAVADFQLGLVGILAVNCKSFV